MDRDCSYFQNTAQKLNAISNHRLKINGLVLFYYGDEMAKSLLSITIKT